MRRAGCPHPAANCAPTSVPRRRGGCPHPPMQAPPYLSPAPQRTACFARSSRRSALASLLEGGGTTEGRDGRSPPRRSAGIDMICSKINLPARAVDDRPYGVDGSFVPSFVLHRRGGCPHPPMQVPSYLSPAAQGTACFARFSRRSARDGTSRTRSPTGRDRERAPCRGRRPRRPAVGTTGSASGIRGAMRASRPTRSFSVASRPAAGIPEFVIARRAKPDVAIRIPLHRLSLKNVTEENGLPRRFAPRNDKTGSWSLRSDRQAESPHP